MSFIDHRSHAPYSFPVLTPFSDRLYVVSAISNPVRYQSRYRLYHNFEKQIADAGAILYTVEMAFGDRPFEVTSPDNPRHIRVRGKHELWHKENLLNIGISRLPSDAKYIAWIDADVDFSRTDWAQETLQQLQHYDVVQMFSQAVNLGPNYEILHTALSWTESVRQKLNFRGVTSLQDSGSYIIDQNKKGLIKGAWHSGFAWAAKRSALDALGGLFECAILGSADRHMAAALYGFVDKTILPNINPHYKEQLKLWESRAERSIRRNIGQVDGTLIHHFHGKRKDRRYVDRWQVLINNNFDPLTDIKKDSQGLWQLNDDGSERMIKLRNELREYFRGRNEDSIDV